MSLVPGSLPYWDLTEDIDTTQEYDLFDSVICEKTDIGGFPILYYVKLNTDDFDKVDELYGEDPNEEFSNAYRSKIIYEPQEEIQILGVFGMTSDETLQYVQIPKTIFTRDIENSYLTDYTDESELSPKVGDTIRTLWNNKTYEIVEFGAEQNVFQAKKLVWEFILRPYRHSEESDSSEDLLFYDPDESDFPDINEDTTTKELSAFGDNDFITKAASEISDDVDSSIYGY